MSKLSAAQAQVLRIPNDPHSEFRGSGRLAHSLKALARRGFVKANPDYPRWWKLTDAGRAALAEADEERLTKPTSQEIIVRVFAAGQEYDVASEPDPLLHQ